MIFSEWMEVTNAGRYVPSQSRWLTLAEKIINLLYFERVRCKMFAIRSYSLLPQTQPAAASSWWCCSKKRMRKRGWKSASIVFPEWSAIIREGPQPQHVCEWKIPVKVRRDRTISRRHWTLFLKIEHWNHKSGGHESTTLFHKPSNMHLSLRFAIDLQMLDLLL